MRFLPGKERFVFGAALAALFANAVLTFGNLDGLVAAQRDVTRSQRVLAELARLESTLDGAESAQRRFLYTGGVTSLAPLEAARTVLAIQLDRLHELTLDEASRSGPLAELGVAARRRLSDLAEEVRLFRLGRPGPAAPPTGSTAERLEGSAVRNALDALEAAERRSLAGRESTALRRRFAAYAAGLVSTVLGLCLVVIGLLLLRGELAANAAAAAALEKANSTLRDADRRKDEFLASLAHELRNPLAAMRNAVELLASTDGSDDPKAPERRDLARSVLSRQLAHLTRLVDDLLDLSRVASSRILLRKEAVTLAEIVEAALETTRPAVEARRHVLTVQGPGASVLVEGDPVRLAQVVANLVSNAARYAPPGGHIAISVAADDAEAIVRVTDDGIGLAPRDLERVFGLFEQGPVRPEGDDGLGVGLALSRRLAQLHGGSLTAASPGPGRGSTFTLRLPRASAPARPEAPPSPAAPDASPRRVLLVEDNSDGARALAEVLSISGHDVHVAGDGPAGLDAARRLLPDAIVLDVGLPGFDGYELARRVRADASLSGTLLVALSGWTGREDAARAAEAGLDHHLVKPVNVARLRELLSTSTPRPRT